MTNKGQAGILYIYGIMVGLVVLLLAFYLAPALSESTNEAMSESNLNCSSTDLSDVNKITCYATDLTLTYFIGFLILVALAIIGGKIIFA